MIMPDALAPDIENRKPSISSAHLWRRQATARAKGQLPTLCTAGYKGAA